MEVDGMALTSETFSMENLLPGDCLKRKLKFKIKGEIAKK